MACETVQGRARKMMLPPNTLQRAQQGQKSLMPERGYGESQSSTGTVQARWWQNHAMHETSVGAFS